MSKLDKFFKSKDVKKEKELQKNAPKPSTFEDDGNKNILAGELGIDGGDFSGRTVTLTKEGIKIDEVPAAQASAPVVNQWKAQPEGGAEAPPPPAPEKPAPEKKPTSWAAGRSRRQPEVKLQQEDFPTLGEVAKMKETHEPIKKSAPEPSGGEKFKAAGSSSAPSGGAYRPPGRSAWSSEPSDFGNRGVGGSFGGGGGGSGNAGSNAVFGSGPKGPGAGSEATSWR